MNLDSDSEDTDCSKSIKFVDDFQLINKCETFGAPILKSGNVKKRSKMFFYKKRVLLLTGDGRLIFIKGSGKNDEEIVLGRHLVVTLCKSTKFTIKSKSFHKTIDCEDAQAWVSMLNLIIK